MAANVYALLLPLALESARKKKLMIAVVLIGALAPTKLNKSKQMRYVRASARSHDNEPGSHDNEKQKKTGQ